MDLTKLAIPAFFATMALEAKMLSDRAQEQGESTADYERNDALASLAMGTGSLILPIYFKRATKELRPTGRYGRALLGVAVAAVAVTTAADAVSRRRRRSRGISRPIPGNVAPAGGHDPTGSQPELRPLATEPATGHATELATTPSAAPADTTEIEAIAAAIAKISGPLAVGAAGLSIASAWGYYTSPQWLWRHRLTKDRPDNLVTIAAAIACWDFVYYWNHRFAHEFRYLWAIHVTHHSSERYNLTTALRQSWTDSFGTFVPYFVALFGVRPSAIEIARGINLLYQYWIHTDLINRIGPLERVLNTPSHHRVHHGLNRQYLDRNYGSIVIAWDRIFGSFEPENEPVVYGLTKNINSFNPLRIATHEYRDIFADISTATNWPDRVGFAMRSPGWAYARKARLSEP